MGARTPKLLTMREWRKLARALNLSPRELQIAKHVVRDDTEHDIAEELGISPHTVHTYLDRLHHKLGVGSRVQLVVRLFLTL
jgi:DNA-binding CsgD family transcriptional regulator